MVLIAVLAIANLRGVREAGLLFAAPTYAYMLAMYGLLAFGLFRIFSGDVPASVTPPDPFLPQGIAALSILLVLRAFASGSVGLTGSEAVANGVPSFRRPEATNAVITPRSHGHDLRDDLPRSHVSRHANRHPARPERD